MEHVAASYLLEPVTWGRLTKSEGVNVLEGQGVKNVYIEFGAE